MNQSQCSSPEQSLANFVTELSRRRPRHLGTCLDGEIRQPLPAVLYRIYRSPGTLEHRTTLRILRAIVCKSDQSTLGANEITALSADMLHLLYYLISDYKECRYSPEDINAGIIWMERQAGVMPSPAN
jgi:hypothetical protein